MIRAGHTREENEQLDRLWRAVAVYYRRFGAEVPIVTPNLAPADAEPLTEVIEAATHAGCKLSEEAVRAATSGGRFTAAMERYRCRFGPAAMPVTFGLSSDIEPQATALLLAAVERGEPLGNWDLMAPADISRPLESVAIGSC